MDPNAGAGTDPNKILEQVAKDLGLLYKACAEADPSGQTCDAVGAMLHALGPLGQQLQSAAAGGAAPSPPPDYPVPPGQQGPMDQAGAALAAQLGGGAPPSPIQ